MFETQLKALQKFAKDQWEAYKQTIRNCSRHAHGKWMEQVDNQHQESIVKTLLAARTAFLEIRSCMQQMGKLAYVPIEPESQTRLLDATMDMERVLLAGIPGAGSFVAIFAITLGESMKNVAKAWSSLGVLPLLVREDPCGVSLECADPLARELSCGVSSIHIG